METRGKGPRFMKNDESLGWLAATTNPNGILISFCRDEVIVYALWKHKEERSKRHSRHRKVVSRREVSESNRECTLQHQDPKEGGVYKPTLIDLEAYGGQEAA